MTDRVFFDHTVAAMFLHAFPPASSNGLAESLRAGGIDPDKPLLPAYDYAIWRDCLERQRTILFPNEPVDEGSRRQGERYVEAYFERTLLGGPLKLLLRAIGPRRTLQRLTLNFRSGNNFSVTSFEARGANEGVIEVNDVFSRSAHYIVGMLEQGLRLIGVASTVKVLRHEGDAATFSVTWG